MATSPMEVNSSDNYLLNTEQEVGNWNGNTLYRKIFSGTKSSAGLDSLINTDIPTNKVVKYEAYCQNANDIIVPYYVSSTDMFRVFHENKYIKTQTGSSYPALPATITVIVYYIK